MRIRTVIALLGAALVVGGCGESDEDQARDQACEARADIAQQVEKLGQLTPATITADAVRTSVEAIQGDLQDIADAAGELSDELRQQFAGANDAFKAELEQIGSTLLRSTSVTQARTQLEAAASELAASYRATLATVDCEE